MVYLKSVTNAIPDNLRDAYAHCARITHDHYENFPVASWLLPARIRPHVCSIYAFARTADDFADEPGMEREERLEKLEDWKQRLNGCLDNPQGPVFEALGTTIKQFGIPLELLEDLLDAFRQDVIQSRHQTFDDLLAYAKRSANPVGRLVLTLFGYTQLELFQQSDALCTALQLTNFWQDIGIDRSRNRIYLPQQEMARYGITETDLSEEKVSPGFRSLLRDLVARTRDLFDQGSDLPDRVSGRLRYELRLTWLGGTRILDEIERADYDVFHRRPTLSKWTGITLLIRSLRPVRVAS